MPVWAIIRVLRGAARTLAALPARPATMPYRLFPSDPALRTKPEPNRRLAAPGATT